MPNGGSDCCGSCWFNAKNKGQAGFDHADDPEPDFCTIRDLAIKVPFYTYCGNHPHRRPEQDPIPIGPVFTGDPSGAREFWKPSPDTEEIRQHCSRCLTEWRSNQTLSTRSGSTPTSSWCGSWVSSERRGRWNNCEESRRFSRTPHRLGHSFVLGASSYDSPRGSRQD